MDQIKAMRVFVRCVERGSFSAVAAEFNTTQPTISKLVAALEAHLGGDLFVRASSGVRLTVHGQQYYQQCRDIVQAIAQAEQGFGRSRAAVAGRIRLTASFAFGRIQVIPHLPALLARHPQLQVDLHLSDYTIDMLGEDVDIAFRFGELRDSGLVARQVASSRRLTVASPDYLRRSATPLHPVDLASHDCIHFDGPGTSTTWTYRRAAPGLPAASKPAGRTPANASDLSVATTGRFRTNSPESVRQAAVAGLGIAQIGQWMLGEDLRSGALVALLDGYLSPEVPIYAVWQKSGRHVASVRAVADFFSEVFRQDPWLVQAR
ncbi:MAG: LysR family transcriptional regulator [Polaromonas sp.]|nr:LysR family transcriptional regulator [Polaromonas sp.]